MGNVVSPDPRVKSFLYACFNGKETVAKQLIAKGVDVNSKDSYGNTAVHRAVLGNRPRILSMLIEHGVDLDAVNKNKWTALHIAVNEGLAKCVEILVNNSCDVNMKTKHGNTAFHMAVTKRPLAELQLGEEDHSDRWSVEDLKRIIDLLINSPRIIFNTKDAFNRNCFQHSVFFGNNFAVQQLISKVRYMASIVDEDGIHALHTAAQMGHHSVVVSLIELAKCDVNVKSAQNMTPLHCAVSASNGSIVRILIEKGIDCDAQDINGNTALHLAFAEAMRKECLENAAVDVDLYGSSLFSLPCIKNIFLMITERKANIFAENNNQQTPLDFIHVESYAFDELKKAIVEAYFRTQENSYISNSDMSVYEDTICGSKANTEESLQKKYQCEVCMDKSKSYIFMCGHGACEDCVHHLQSCHICRKKIKSKIKIY